MENFPVAKDLIERITNELEEKLRANNLLPEDQAQLLHELSSLYSLLGAKQHQVAVLQRAILLCPNNKTIRQSLKITKS